MSGLPKVLVGSTGFVGGALTAQIPFDLAVHRPDVNRVRGMEAELLVVAGLPGTKWLANRNPAEDWDNMARLAAVLATVTADRTVLISTVDVFDPAVDVNETSVPAFASSQAYGRHRAWFEAFFRAQFPDALVVRLPALFGPGLRKNLVYDLVHGRKDQWAKYSARSTLQFFDVRDLANVISRSRAAGLRVLNVATEPVAAQDVAQLFDVSLPADLAPTNYDVRSQHADLFGGDTDYLVTAERQLRGIRLWADQEVSR